MKLNVFVAQVTPETWFRDTRDERQVLKLSCLDRESFLGLKLVQTFDYMPSQEEAEEIDLMKLDGASVALSVSEFKPANGGRLVAKGKLDRSTLPKEAVNANGAGSQAPSQKAAGK